MNNKELLEQRKIFLEDIIADLDMLEHDQQLLASGFSIYYVIDFSAIYAYIHRTLDKSSVLTIPSSIEETEEAIYSRQQIALEYLFSRKCLLILIPPYLIEMQNHINNIQLNITTTSSDFIAQFKRKITTLLNKDKTIAEYLSTSNKKNLSDLSFEELLDFGKRYFRELYALSMISIGHPFTILRSLFEEEVLVNFDNILGKFPELVNLNYLDQQFTRPYYLEILKKRHGERSYQSYIDAAACAFVQQANQCLIQNNAKKVIYLATPSQHIRELRHNRIMVQGKSGIRDLDFFLLNMTHGADPIRRQNTKALAEELLQGYASVESTSDIEIINDVLQKTQDMWSQIENLLIAQLVQGSTRWDTYLLSKNVTDKTFVDLLRELLKVIGGNSDRIAAEVESLFASINNNFAQAHLEKLFDKPELLNSLRKSAIEQSGRNENNEVLLFPGLPGEMPFWIKFTEKQIIDLATIMIEFRAQNDADDIRKIRLKIIKNYARLKEIYLLRAYVLTSEKRYEAAIKELKTGLLVNERSGKNEHLYFLGMINRKLFRGEEAIGYLQKAVDVDRDDPRILLEYGNALWLGWRNSEVKGTLVEAIGNIEKAIKLVNEERLNFSDTQKKVIFQQASNLLAFLYTEMCFNYQDEIESCRPKAIEWLARLDDYLKREEWIGRFWDTAGWLSLFLATISTTIDDKRRRLEQAINEFDNALSDKELVPEKRVLILDHKKKTERLLNEIR